ncbi:translation initiation factor IF-2 [Mycoplasma sp. 1654_15]|uniref:translation initiation factor IF-2 n=1 Tax=Mycoplasma sp. 1654_15 TaxID=2725994 RepID=UPI001449326E|nr:translation initiation factor IF-2 [Mycoplasma sp. 1654_15]QJB71117.1 translation initiation factor IF-2 [Mycoplasma sp. 1654_15]
MAKKEKRKSNINEIKSQLNNVKVEVQSGVFTFTGAMLISEFAQKINKPATEIITYFFKQGKMYNLNHIINEEEIAEICLEYGLDFQKEKEINASNFMDEVSIVDSEAELQTRPPIITIMGHVDHGKTTLLDYIRKSKITDSEFGGITQHTGAYQVEYNKNLINFIDTPGHEAFTQMRARGAKVTDIVILVVAADDGVMPQTKEAIHHAQAADVPIIVFVNKMDKPNKDVDRIKNELVNLNIIPDEWGGKNIFVYGSGKTGQGVDDLFEAILVQSEVLDLKANKNRFPIGTVIEAKLHHGKGTVATLIVQNGTLKLRDFIVAGSQYGKIRTLEDTNGHQIEQAQPGTPVIITGLNYVPQAGDKFFGFPEEKFAKQLAEERKFLQKQSKLIQKNSLSKEENKDKVINLIIKADVQGIAEAIQSVVEKMSTKEVHVNVLHSAVGLISKSDILLAQTSNAKIFAFNIQVPNQIKQEAKQAEITISEHTIIYKIIEELKAQIKGLRTIQYEEVETGYAEIIRIFWYSKVGSIAGCSMKEGKILANSKVALYRNKKLIHKGRIESLQRDKNDVKEVVAGNEFGTHIVKFNDIQLGDIIKAYQDVEIVEKE